jgi:hypothetical protein
MPDTYVREIAKVEDSTDETFLAIGVDYDTVAIGDYRFHGESLERFAQVFIAACWAAGYNKHRMEEESTDMGEAVTATIDALRARLAGDDA